MYSYNRTAGGWVPVYAGICTFGNFGWFTMTAGLWQWNGSQWVSTGATTIYTFRLIRE